LVAPSDVVVRASRSAQQQLPPAALQHGALVASWSGDVWVRRTRLRAGDPEAYDVIGPALQIVRTLTFPPDTRVVSVGQYRVYAVRRDSDDLEVLQRHRLPPLR
jgi:hypothetical protein